MAEKRSDILVSRAANALRKAAAVDRSRRAELSSIADYLESIVYQDELRAEAPKRDDMPKQDGVSVSREVKRMMKPFKVRLVR
ncbi:MAG: hypothetical protein JNK21_16480 [Rhodospirillaceae bacterium]|nr:hypothetical protein [Rhodospirillaceae bacterium]